MYRATRATFDLIWPRQVRYSERRLRGCSKCANKTAPYHHRRRSAYPVARSLGINSPAWLHIDHRSDAEALSLLWSLQTENKFQPAVALYI